MLYTKARMKELERIRLLEQETLERPNRAARRKMVSAARLGQRKADRIRSRRAAAKGEEVANGQ